MSISIVCFHTPPSLLKDTVTSLAAALQCARGSYRLDATVALVNNGEMMAFDAGEFADLRALLHSAGAGLALIQGQGNVGFGAGHNLAIAPSEADYHLVLNPDVELAPDCLLQGLDYLQANTRVCLASPQARDQRGRRQYLCKRYPGVMMLLLRGFLPGPLRGLIETRQADYELRQLPDNRPSTGVPIVSGCFMLCRRQPLQQVNGFDERYFLYFEDFDLSLRLRRFGELAYVPAMRIVHHGGAAARKGWRHVALFARSGRRFFAQHGWRWW